ncbi:exported hypothetical protein [Capnocytophaga canimorsus]|uniref:Uncharacterized protein n=1 Tax=Capnocytophaga canimorsus TaxID=28188 RepID=A0A0B7HLX1_9FLAO|nr:exported hypothetical protein [Capnocytophaga canimorsus]
MKLQKILFIFSLLVAISLKAQTNLAPQVIPSIQQWEGKTGYLLFLKIHRLLWIKISHN